MTILSALPIAGTFSNLPDDGTFTSNDNTYQVSYEGGDGNDLTLTVRSLRDRILVKNQIMEAKGL